MNRFIPVIILLTLFGAVVFTSVNTKSPVSDACAHHIGSGYSYVKTGDFRMNPSTPPLLRILMALPLLPMDLELPLEDESWQTINSSEFNYEFLFVNNRAFVNRIVLLARLPMIALSVLLGLLIYLWASKLYGHRAGVFGLFLYRA